MENSTAEIGSKKLVKKFKFFSIWIVFFHLNCFQPENCFFAQNPALINTQMCNYHFILPFFPLKCWKCMLLCRNWFQKTSSKETQDLHMKLSIHVADLIGTQGSVWFGLWSSYLPKIVRSSTQMCNYHLIFPFLGLWNVGEVNSKEIQELHLKCFHPGSCYLPKLYSFKHSDVQLSFDLSLFVPLIWRKCIMYIMY